MKIKIICLGDIIGKKGRGLLKAYLPYLINKYEADFVIVNGENAAGGFGLTPKIADEFLNNNVDVITSGNHIWRRREIFEYLNNSNRILRPLNYPESSPGKGYSLIQKNGIKYLIINVLGSVYMESIIPPFYSFNNFYNSNKELFKKADVVITDFHAEATSEKIAFGYFLQDRVNLVFGTHTHVQTADERIISEKTAYITDIGMTGPIDSVIGMDKEIILYKFSNLIPKRYKIAEGKGIINGCYFEFDPVNKKALKIERIKVVEDQKL